MSGWDYLKFLEMGKQNDQKNWYKNEHKAINGSERERIAKDVKT